MSDVLGDASAAVFDRAAEVFALLSAPSRLRLLAALCEGECCVGDLVARAGMPQPKVSQQLNLLFRAGLLSRRRDGVQVYYRLDPQSREFLCRAIQTFVR